MDSLPFIASYMHRPTRKKAGMSSLSINLITNFTDDVLERILGGMCIAENIYPRITRVPYKQYALAFKNAKSSIYGSKSDISYIFFDASPYRHSEFADPSHGKEILAEIEAYVASVRGIVVVSLCTLPYHGPYGRFFSEEPLFHALSEFNAGIRSLAERTHSVYVFDTHKVLSQVGEMHARDLRSHHAFDMPFTTDFLALLAHEWLSYARALLGRSRKCIVLDLDNTLWGGVLGEEGPLGISLGSDYPGLSYQNFQRALLSFYNRGVILAVNSKNNEAEVEEVFRSNLHMILKREHFAALRVNWSDKSANIKSLAKELNIGLDSMVFIDDSPLERARMREEAPQVLTPEWTTEPEQYVKDLFGLAVFDQLSLTSEDRKRGVQYVEEKKRKEVQHASRSADEYLARLNITMRILEGEDVDIARVAQLTQKTNQFNLTTKRYSQAVIQDLIKKGSLVYTAEVADTFGGYGVVLLAIVTCKKKEAVLDTFLMSCRVMGRDVERAFFEYLVTQLHAKGTETLRASYLRTAKNEPAALFLPGEGMKPKGGRGDYVLAVSDFCKKLVIRTKRSPVAIMD